MEQLKYAATAPRTPKPRSIASRCSKAARGLGFQARTLSYAGGAERFLFVGEAQDFMCYSWEELLEELRKRGATIPLDYWEVDP